jgi:8-oxo-dGTP pyrophosphatase MutT (NUDIX family)
VARVPTRSQVSAGGVVYRKHGDAFQAVLIAVGAARRWQLPKGLVDPGETHESTALREVAEETGIRGTLQAPIDRIEYWYFGEEDGKRVRVHKVVHFFLIAFASGNTDDHDHEVLEARWFDLDEAKARLAFKSEQGVMARAKDMLEGGR